MENLLVVAGYLVSTLCIAGITKVFVEIAKNKLSGE